jgi:hypothetical protein
MPIDKGKIINQLWQLAENDPSLQLYALLDAARDARIHSRLVEDKAKALSLFRGEKARELAEVAPYLFALDRDGPLIDWLLEYGWGNSWGIVVESAFSLSELRRHFQSLIMIYDEKARPLYFRYYDPRVLRVYLPTCNETELSSVFGPVSSYYLEGEESNVLLHYSLSDRRLMERKVRL